MLRGLLALAVCVVLVATGYAQAAKSISNIRVSAETECLLQQWRTTPVSQNRSTDAQDGARGRALTRFLARSDADLCLVRYVIGGTSPHDIETWSARTDLGKLNTKRSFDLIVPLLKSKDIYVRTEAAAIIGEFRARTECVPLFIDLAERDSYEGVRRAAIEALGHFKDPRAEDTLLKFLRSKEKSLAMEASGALADMNSKAGAELMAKRLRDTPTDEEAAAMLDTCKFYRKCTIDALLEVYARVNEQPVVHYSSIRFSEGAAGEIQRTAIGVLWRWYHMLNRIGGPEPDCYVEEWQDWWTRVEPLLTDDMKLKPRREEKPKQYAESEFGSDPNDLEMLMAVDCDTFRVHDPIRLDVTFKNNSDKPYRVIPPELWQPGGGKWEYQVRLTRGDEVLCNTDPNLYWMGSSRSPPQPVILGPKEEVCRSTCLQSFLRYQIKGQLSEGKYRFELTFNSDALYADPKLTPVVGSWTAKPTTFTIKGEERTDPKEILDLIAQKTNYPLLKYDLASRISERRERARQALWPYADKRLQANKDLPDWIRTDYYIRD